MTPVGTRARRLALIAIPLLVAAGIATVVVTRGSGSGGEATPTTVASGPRSARCTEGPVAVPVAARVIPPKTPQVIEVGDRGFTPADLVAVRGFEIIWKNTSGSARAIHFDNYSTTDEPIESAPIPPGGSWTWCPARGASVVYSSTSIPGARGHFQVEEELKPGESPF